MLRSSRKITVKSFPNGVRYAFDPMQGVRSCSMGVWLEIGSRFERSTEQGITHFIEHMFFKGIPRLDALALNDELNRLGGNVNAHTSQENLCLNARCVDDKAPAALDLLCEMALDSVFADEEIRRERNVILEEYKMYEDNPEEVVVDRFFRNLWPASPLGSPVIGSPATIRRFSRAAVKNYIKREFHPSRILIVLAGAFDTRECEAVIRSRFAKLRSSSRGASRAESRIQYAARKQVISREVEQVHFCFGGPGPERGSPDRFAFGLLNMVLGGGMSSRLFKEVREKRGLAYSIQSFTQPYRGAGSYAIDGSTGLETIGETLAICRNEVARLIEEPIPNDELDLAKEQIVDSVLMNVEGTSSRMMALSESLMTLGRPVAPEEIVTQVRRVTSKDALASARKYLAPAQTAAAYVAPKGCKLSGF